MVAFIIVAVLLVVAIVGVNIYLLRRPPFVGPSALDVDRAIGIVWVGVYGQIRETLPRIEWITGKALDCANGTGWMDPSYGSCVAGLTFHDRKLCKVAWVSGELLSDTAFAHELCHYYLDLMGVNSDANHTGPAFAAGGIKDKANDALRAMGL